MIAFVINVFSIISTKQKMDHLADQLVKQIQLNGGINSNTTSLFNNLSKQINASSLKYTVSSTDSTSSIQIGTPFYVTVTGTCNLGGIWKIKLVKITLQAKGAGVSERYFK